MKKLFILSALLLLLFLKPIFANVAKELNVAEVQTILTKLCFNPGPIDGVWGKKTEKATQAFFNKYFEKYGGYLGHREFKMLKATEELSSKSLGGEKLKRCILDKNIRKGSLDLEERLNELTEKGLLRSRCGKSWVNLNSEPEVIKTLMPADQDYGGSDARVQPVSNLLINLTAACFGGSKIACNSGIKSLRQYALIGAPFENNQAKYKKNLRTINAYIMNTSFISHVINFLSVYDQNIGLTEQELINFDDWLKTIVERYRKKDCRSDKPIDLRKHGHRNSWSTANHCVSSAISSAALGSWLDDEKLLNEGIKQWGKTLGTMRKDGSLPHETARGSKAIEYSGYTITKLMRLAEILRQNGTNLYSLEIRGKTIHDNVSFYLDVMETPDLIHKYAKFNINSGSNISYQDQEESGRWSGHHAWIPLYMLRFPDHPNTKRLKNFSGKENKHSQNLFTVIKSGYGGTYGLDADSECFYSKP